MILKLKMNLIIHRIADNDVGGFTAVAIFNSKKEDNDF
jgi:hypothetical protein